MQRTSLMLPPELQQQAAELAARRGISLGELIRQCLVRETAIAYDAGLDPLWTEVPTFASEHGSLAANHDDELYGPIRRVADAP